MDLFYRALGDKRHIISPYTQFLPYDETRTIIWHAIYGHPMLVKKSLADRLKADIENELEVPVDQLLGEDGTRETREALWRANILGQIHFHGDGKIPEILSMNNDPEKCKVRALSLIMSEDCPYRCKYCIHFANAEHAYSGPKLMTHEIATKAINDFMTLVAENDIEEAYINFGGGEPLMNWDLLATLLDEIEDWRSVMPVKLGINTNLALLTEEIAECLIRHDVYVAASLDGLQRGNDAVRITRDKQGTYDQILKGFQVFENLGHPLDGFAMTVTEENFSDIDAPLIDWAAARGMKEVRIDIDVVGAVEIPIPEIIEALMKVRRYGRKKGINVIGFWSRPAENMGLNINRDDIAFCGAARGDSICVAPSGDVYPCGYGNYCICDYSEIEMIPRLASYRHIISRHAKFYETPWCEGCEILGFCQGGCQITGEYNEPGKFERMCELYRGMTHEILRDQVAKGQIPTI